MSVDFPVSRRLHHLTRASRPTAEFSRRFTHETLQRFCPPNVSELSDEIAGIEEANRARSMSYLSGCAARQSLESPWVWEVRDAIDDEEICWRTVVISLEDEIASLEFTPERLVMGEDSSALLVLTHYGMDAIWVREVDLYSGAPAANGINFQGIIARFDWMSANDVLVTRQVAVRGQQRWVIDRIGRGEEVERLHIFPDQAVVGGVIPGSRTGSPYHLLVEWATHSDRRYFVGTDLRTIDNWVQVPVPGWMRVDIAGSRAVLVGGLGNRVDEDSTALCRVGQLASLEVGDLLRGDFSPAVSLVPQGAVERTTAVSVGAHSAAIVLESRNCVRLEVKDLADGSLVSSLEFPPERTVRLLGKELTSDGDRFFVTAADAVNPPVVRAVGEALDPAGRIVHQGRSTFDDSNFRVCDRFVRSGEHSSLRYTVVSPVGMELDGCNRTVLTGYGAFNVRGRVEYMDLSGPLWLESRGEGERSGVYVFAHLDAESVSSPADKVEETITQFLAVAAELGEIGIADSHHLGALGVSHGGLMVMNAMLLSPSSFGAVACRSGVFDLGSLLELGGDSWIHEYGDPRRLNGRASARRISPLENVRSGVNYPPTLLWTSDNDDRVHPAHSRKMAARLAEVRADVSLMETHGGGHDNLIGSRMGATGLVTMWDFFRLALNDSKGQRGRRAGYRAAPGSVNTGSVLTS